MLKRYLDDCYSQKLHESRKFVHPLVTDNQPM